MKLRVSSADFELIALLSNLDAAIIECVGGEQDSAVAVAALSLGPSSPRASVVCDFGSGPTILMTTRTRSLSASDCLISNFCLNEC